MSQHSGMLFQHMLSSGHGLGSACILLGRTLASRSSRYVQLYLQARREALVHHELLLKEA